MKPTLSKEAVLSRLFDQPESFDFFQATYLLESMAHQLNFKANPSLSFPITAIAGIKTSHPRIAEMVVNFIGLTGPSGVLPYHYTELLLQRLQQKDTSLKDFLDIFNHRIITLFYESWKKYRLYLNDKKFHTIFAAIIGNGTAYLKNRAGIPEQALYFYAGILGQRLHPADGLKTILAHYFNLSLEVKQFQGRWLYLALNQCSRLTNKNNLQQHNYAQLGETLILGSKVWDTQSKFRLVIGPLKYKKFKRLLPIGDMHQVMIQFTKYYTGITLDFDIQLKLESVEVPYCKLKRKNPLYLGWDTWLGSYRAINEKATVILKA